MSIEDFLSRLEGVQGDGHDGWMAICPAHPDKNPSMHVNVRGGKILVKCHAGCSTESVVAAMGLKMSDLMPDDGRGRSKSKAKAKGAKRAASAEVKPLAAYRTKKRPTKHVCYYDYQDEKGSVIYRVDRRVYTDAEGGKTFIQQHPDPNSRYGWSYGVNRAGVRRVPFRLPRVLAAAKAGKRVVIVEGEKDVINVEKRLGLVATCNSGGAGKWEASWAQYFDGVPAVLIVADKDALKKVDERTGEERIHARGQRHACDVEAKLLAGGYSGQIRKVAMPDVEIEQGVTKRVKDFTDWCEAMDAASREVDRSAFKAAIDEFGEWPEEWKFGAADLDDLQRAQKSARKSASITPPQDDGAGLPDDGAEDGPADGMGDSGRFGRLVPRAPADKARVYSVDFQINSKRRARLNVGVDHFEFEAWIMSDVDHKFYKLDYPSIKVGGPLTNYLGHALGCMYSFCDNDTKAYKHLIGDMQCRIALCWLRSRGVFFADRDNPCYELSMFFNEGDGMLYVIRSAEFLSYLATVANISRKVRTFDMMMALIDDLAMNREETARVVPARQWDKKDGNIYISCGDSMMYRVKPNAIDRVNNGTDGVLFLRGFTFDEWTLQDGPGLDPFSSSLAFKTAAWKDDNSVMNIRLWYLNLFYCHKNKPLLLIEGPAGSGKTTIARLIKAILSMRDRGKPDSNVNTVANTDKGAEDFWVIVHNGRLEVFDNLDQKIKWANNELQTVSTGGSHKGRQLYHTDDVYILYPNASIILTSNNPIFATEGGGLPDRIIQAHIGLGRKESFDNELILDIEQNRDKFMTWTARILSAALADAKPVDQTINKRHPDYGNFSVRCSRAFGREVDAIRAMSAAEIDKAILPLMNETVAKEVYAVLLRQEPKGCMKFTAGQMSDAIIKHIGEDDADDKTKTIFGSRRVGKALSTFRKEFSVIFRMREPRILEGKTLYEFEGLTAQGSSIVAASSGGLVGLNADFRKNPLIEKGAGDFSENNPPNPPNPPNAHGLPYARADAQGVYPLNGKNEIREELGESLDDFDF